MANEVDTNSIIDNLTELLQNSVNMTSVFYDIFINPEPMDVTLTQYNAEGELITITVPNRAKDQQRALVGTGSPEGTVAAPEGTLYVDSVTQTVYVKVNGSDATGWKIILTEEGIYTYVRNYLLENGYYSTETLERYLTENEYVKEAVVQDVVRDALKDSKLIIERNNTPIGSFSADQTETTTIDISVPVQTSELLNDAGFITSISSIDVTTALGYNPQEELIQGTGIIISGNTISATGSATIDVDTTMSTISTNPVQNKVISAALEDKQDILTAGAGITISNNIISATGMTVPIDDTLSNVSVNPVQNKVITSAIENKTIATFTNISAGTSADVTNLIINKVTTAEYATITPSDTELYFVTDAPYTEIDSTLNPTSTNPVENAVITNALASKGTLVTSISAASTDLEYPSAKCIYDLIGTLEAKLQSVIDGGTSP